LFHIVPRYRTCFRYIVNRSRADTQATWSTNLFPSFYKSTARFVFTYTRAVQYEYDVIIIVVASLRPIIKIVNTYRGSEINDKSVHKRAIFVLGGYNNIIIVGVKRKINVRYADANRAYMRSNYGECTRNILSSVYICNMYEKRKTRINAYLRTREHNLRPFRERLSTFR